MVWWLSCGFGSLSIQSPIDLPLWRLFTLRVGVTVNAVRGLKVSAYASIASVSAERKVLLSMTTPPSAIERLANLRLAIGFSAFGEQPSSAHAPRSISDTVVFADERLVLICKIKVIISDLK